MQHLALPTVRRESNIELLRVVLMMMIIGFHLLVHGAGVGSSEAYTLSSTTDMAYVVLKSFLVPAVNCFVFISGYFRIRLKIKTVLSMLLQASFFAIMLVVALETTPLSQLGFMKILETLLPLFSGTWWFITAYFALYLLSPLLNRSIDSFTRKQFLFVLLSLTFINCVCGLLFDASPMGANRGFSLISFINIYLLGQYIRHHAPRPRLEKWAPAVYIAASLLIFLLAYLSITVAGQRGISLVFAYNNPLVLVSSIALFFLFKRFTLQSRFINSLSPYVLGVYLFHDHPLMRQYLIEHLYLLSQQASVLLHFAYLLLITLAVFIAGVVVDRLRQYLLAPLLRYLMQKSDIMRLEAIFPRKTISGAASSTSGNRPP